MVFSAAIGMLLLQATATAPAARPAPQPVTKAQIQGQIKAAFDRLDANKDGAVDAKEALAAAQTARTARLGAIFTRLDANKDGSISRSEFDATQGPARGDPWVTRNDTNKDGRVTLSELSTKELREFDALDKDKNGVISAAEAPRVTPARR